MARILGDWVRGTGWMPVLHDREEDERFLAGLLNTHSVRVARSGAEVLGFLAHDGGSITALYIADGARGQGIGRAFLEDVKAVESEIALWAFQANVRAVSFYQREGFAVADETDGRGNDEGLPDLRLVWKRTP
jgi:GNAT superfamily N-acetyltransferase